MGSQSYRREDLVGLVGQGALVDWVDSSANLQVGREVWGESMGASLEVQVVGSLVDPEVGCLADPEVGHLVDPEVGRLVGWAAWWTWRLTTLRVRWLIVS